MWIDRLLGELRPIILIGRPMWISPAAMSRMVVSELRVIDFYGNEIPAGWR